jgi:hypothetical protein
MAERAAFNVFAAFLVARSRDLLMCCRMDDFGELYEDVLVAPTAYALADDGDRPNSPARATADARPLSKASSPIIFCKLSGTATSPSLRPFFGMSLISGVGSDSGPIIGPVTTKGLGVL